MVQSIGPAMDFIADFAQLPSQTQTPEHSLARQIELPTASSYEFIQKVAQAFQDHGGQLICGARVEKLLLDDQKQVQGVQALGKNISYDLFATTVVLAAGGHGANQKMRGPESQGLNYYGPLTSTSDAYSFNRPLNLATHNLDWYKIYPHGVEVEPGVAKLTTYASKKATDLGDNLRQPSGANGSLTNLMFMPLYAALSCKSPIGAPIF
ncbi:FAD-dependent oxidoreductase [Bombilactobacillus apium]|uniref:FAD-dependent oxidoreductase n=1 Tax=Bombilactobacillus apium TaxID=2675299 RepID=UPI001E32E4FB|nr:FAD-dependent oxidoreductase [Bombilactobacillus apium]